LLSLKELRGNQCSSNYQGNLIIKLYLKHELIKQGNTPLLYIDLEQKEYDNLGSLQKCIKTKISSKTDIDSSVDEMNYKNYLIVQSSIQKMVNCKVDEVLINKTNPKFGIKLYQKETF
jgi:hypothetical protein